MFHRNSPFLEYQCPQMSPFFLHRRASVSPKKVFFLEKRNEGFAWLTATEALTTTKWTHILWRKEEEKTVKEWNRCYSKILWTMIKNLFRARNEMNLTNESSFPWLPLQITYLWIDEFVCRWMDEHVFWSFISWDFLLCPIWTVCKKIFNLFDR